jgi:peroxiredoxin
MDPTQEQEPAASPPPGGAGAAATLDRRLPLTVTAGLALVGAIVLLAVLFGRAGGGGDPGDPLAMAFVNGDGTTGTLADFDGQPVVVNFFAAWCAPCRAEIPDIEAVHLAAGDRVQIIGISHDFDETTWRSFVAETGLTYPTGFQPDQQIWESLDLIGMPSTVLITPSGEIVYAHTGILNQETLQDLISEHLGVQV